MASSTVNLKALGLNFSPNALELPPGSLIEANNVIIRRDDVIESRRGYKQFGESTPTNDPVKQLAIYRERILKHYFNGVDNKIAYQDGVLNNGQANFTEFSGSYSEVQTGLRIKSVQAKNGNFYFTTNEGIQKISAASADEFTSNSNYIRPAGGVKALDLQARLNLTAGDTSSFLTENSTVAYKLVWGKIDANNVELLGTPSERVVVYNPLRSLLQMDFNRLLAILDNLTTSNSLINSGDYYSLLSVTVDTDAAALRTKMLDLATKIDEDLLFATDVGSGAAYNPLNISTVTASSGIITINFSVGTPANYFQEGDLINLSGFQSNSKDIANLNGNQVIASVSAGSITVLARDYSTASPVGINGTIQSFTADVSGVVTITTTQPHGLTDQQNISLQNTGDNDLNGTRVATVKSSTVFTVQVTSGTVASAGSVGVWNIVIDGIASSKIESNEYRSIEQPSEIIEPRGTGSDLFSLQAYLEAIITKLKSESTNVINSAYSTTIGLSNFSLTKRASVTLEFTVPHNIDDTYYYKLYRTETTQVSSFFASALEDILPAVDYRLALQNYYVPALKTTENTLIIEDTVPVEFLNSENLYTNINTSAGEDAKPNDYPPFAKDINTFKGYTFYSNTKLKQLKSLEMLGVVRLKNELTAGRTPTVIISDGTSYNNCKISFVRGVKRVVTIAVPATSPTSPIPAAVIPNVNYFDINSANNQTKYRVWFDLTGSTAAPDAGSRKLLRIYIPSNTQDGVGQKIANSLNSLINDFSCAYDAGTNIVTINYVVDGSADAISFGAGLIGFSSSVITAGVGESVTNRQAVISSNDLLFSSVATEQATKSFIRVLNRNTADQLENPSVGFDTYAYYSNTNPGLFLLEGTVFVDSPFYLTTNNSETGISFSPDISPLNVAPVGAAITDAGSGKTLLNFNSSHNFLNGQTIIISNSNSTPNIDGVYVVEYINSTQLKITTSSPITINGTMFSYTKSTLAEFSDNYKKKNRIYYSKYEQPDAVPVNVLTGNFIDIGSEEKEILRIYPLRDSLFIFKEDGLYRLSAEVEPFIVALFDSSCILLAPDSVSVSQNFVYGWTTQGISTISESGVAIVSRPIDTEILKIQSSNYTNFSTATFGVGYESDNSYLVWTVKNTTDTYATQAFRYSSLTGTWTKYTKSNSCGVLNSVDDRLYLGVPTEGFLEQERKSFAREDYADYEYDFGISSIDYNNEILTLSSVDNLNVGDVLTQSQTLTIYDFNSLLKKLDNDPGVADTDYYSSLVAVGGDDLRLKILDLANKLDSDSGVSTTDFYTTIQSLSGSVASATLTSPTIITSNNHGLINERIINIGGATTYPDINGNYQITYIDANTFSIPVSLTTFSTGGNWSTVDDNFDDIVTCYNKIVEKLNSDPNIAFSNYLYVLGNSLLEAVIINIDRIFRKVTLSKVLPLVVGPVTVYNAIQSSVVYSPSSFGDPLSFKQIREATAMFANKAFSLASLSFSTDLLPAFQEVEFYGSGTGLFGNDPFGETFFGGGSNSAPFRTIVPRECQRCRYLNIKFTHRTAREQYVLFGITLTGKTFSTRAYR